MEIGYLNSSLYLQYITIAEEAHSHPVCEGFFESHFVDLSVLFSVYLYSIDYLITKAHFTNISIFIKKSKLICSSFFQFLE